MTSGNLSEEPIARDNDEALKRLSGIADYFLIHNRDIYSRYDDSVAIVERAQASLSGGLEAMLPTLSACRLKPGRCLVAALRRKILSA